MTPRLLLDEQLSERLVDLLADVYPDSLHISQLAGRGAPDDVVWGLAREHGCLLVTKDEDFHRMAILRGVPPRIVWIRRGNCSTEDLARLLRNHCAAVTEFSNAREEAVLELI